MRGFTIRNLKIFFKDRATVLFSLMSVFIIIGLYALFLGDVWTDNFKELDGVKFLMNSWIISGLLAVTSATTTMGAFGIMVDDKSRRANKDFVVSPISNRAIVGGYTISAIVIGIVMSVVTIVISEVYIVLNGGKLLDVISLLKVLGLVILSTITNSSMILFMVSFFKSNNAFSTASTILGTLIGFLTGIYLPIGNLPSGVQWVVKCFPVSHAASLLRQVMMKAPMDATFANVPTEYVNDFNLKMGVKYDFNGNIATPLVSILVLIATSVIFYMLSVWNISRKQK